MAARCTNCACKKGDHIFVYQIYIKSCILFFEDYMKSQKLCTVKITGRITELQYHLILNMKCYARNY